MPWHAVQVTSAGATPKSGSTQSPARLAARAQLLLDQQSTLFETSTRVGVEQKDWIRDLRRDTGKEKARERQMVWI